MTTEAGKLLARLRSQSLRNRVGLWLLLPDQVDQVASIAARLNIDVQDARQVLLDQLPPNTRFAGLSSSKIIGLLDAIVEQPGFSDCVLVYNLDLLLAGLPYEEQQEVWRTLRQSFPHRERALMLAMPAMASKLLPVARDLGAWRHDGRLAGVNASATA